MLVFLVKSSLCSYIPVGNYVCVKSLGKAPGLENAQPPGRAKFAKAPP